MHFDVAFTRVLMMLLFIVPGFLACKFHKINADHLSSISGLLIYCCAPCMIAKSFIDVEFSWTFVWQLGLFAMLVLALEFIFMGLLMLILHKKFDQVKYRVLAAASITGNVGFFGIPVVHALFPDFPQAIIFNLAFVIANAIMNYTFCTYCLTGKKEYMSLKRALLNPSCISFYIGLVLFMLRAGTWIPTVVGDCMTTLKNVSAPVCMIILGVRLSQVSLKKLFTRPMVYVTCALRLLVYPLFCFAALYFLPLPHIMKATLVIVSGVPCAATLLSLSEFYHGESELAANNILLSTFLSLGTIPLLTLIV